MRFGRPPKLNQHQRREALERLGNGETQADIARTYGVDATTIGRLIERTGVTELGRFHSEVCELLKG